jgi:hypothetical protein
VPLRLNVPSVGGFWILCKMGSRAGVRCSFSYFVFKHRDLLKAAGGQFGRRHMGSPFTAGQSDCTDIVRAGGSGNCAAARIHQETAADAARRTGIGEETMGSRFSNKIRCQSGQTLKIPAMPIWPKVRKKKRSQPKTISTVAGRTPCWRRA